MQLAIDRPDLSRPTAPARSSAAYGWTSLYFEHGTAPSTPAGRCGPGAHRLSVQLSAFAGLPHAGPGAVPRPRRGRVDYFPDGYANTALPAASNTAPGERYLLVLGHETVMAIARELGVPGFRGQPCLAADDRFVVEAAESIKLELARGNPHGAMFAEHYARVLATHIVTRYRRPPERVEKPAAFDVDKIRRLDRYIEATLPAPINLGALARQAGLSPYYFCRVFKEATGVSPYRYVLNKRVALAARLLDENMRSIQEVAYAAGFGDPVQFTKTFKQVHGQTPTSYRSGRCPGAGQS